MSGDTVITRNPVHNWEVAVLLQDQLQISRVCNTGKKKLAKKIINLPPPLTPSPCSIWGRRKNLLTWVRFRMISFPDFDEQVFTSTRYVRKGQAGNRNTCMYKCGN